MQSYHYDTAPIPNKGKEPATAYSLKSLKDRPQVLNSTIFNPQTVLDTSKSYGALEVPNGHHRAPRRSSTWTSSTGDLGLLSEGEAVDDREQFVSEYNRLAKKYGIRLLVPGDFAHGAANASNSLPSRKGRWISKVLRQTSSGQISQPGNVKRDQWLLRQRRSISDMAMSFVHHHHYHHKKHGLEDESLPALVRLCGKSLFYLPSEYAPCALVLPTCFRALAQALVQQADSRGIFRVPGSVRIVNTLYDYYCADRDADDVSSTTRSPNLPNHIKYSVHDVASVFKKFLAGLPGGILGSLSLLDALVAIHSQLHGDPELTRTKETKLRARLIALAIGTVKSQYQRELICAVFGLLCLIGRVAENMPREDEQGRPLPTADLMGYNALSIVFGPLLVGDLIDSYNTKLANPAAGLVLLPVTPPRSRKERHKKSKTRAEDANASFTVDKIHVANSITEMLVTNWREVVRHMRSLATLKIRRNLDSHEHRSYRGVLKTSASASDSFPLRKPPGWDEPGSSTWQKDRNVSPLTMSPTPTPRLSSSKSHGNMEAQFEPLPIKRRRSLPSSSSLCKFEARVSSQALSPTVEESPSNEPGARKMVKESQGLSPAPVSSKDMLGIVLASHHHSHHESADSPNRFLDREDHVNKDLGESNSNDNCLPDFSKENRRGRSNTPKRDRSAPSNIDTNSQLKKRHSDKRRANRSSIAEGSDSSGSIRREIFPVTSSAGHTPLRHDRSNTKTRSRTATRLTNTDSDDTTSSYNEQLKSGEPFRVSIHENVAILHSKGPLKPTLCEGEHFSSDSIPEKFPGLRSSLSGDESGQEHPPQAERSTFLNKESEPIETRSLKEESTPTKLPVSSRKDPSRHSTDQWKVLSQSSRASTESLAHLAKERRLTRYSGRISSRHSEESLAPEKKPATPEWKRQLMIKRSVKRKTSVSPKENAFPNSPESTYSQDKASPAKSKGFSPTKNVLDGGSRPVSQRSPSRPTNGAVKAMAALFDNATKDTPTGSAPVISGRLRGSFRESNSALSPYARSDSPAKSTRSPVTPAPSTPPKKSEGRNNPPESVTPNRGNVPSDIRLHLRQTAPRPTVEHTPTKIPISLRRTGIKLDAARKVPQTSPGPQVQQRDRELSQPPSLGTMVPHHEEPPVAQHIVFARPTAVSTAPDDEEAAADSGRAAPPPPPPSDGSPRLSGRSTTTSSLHAQVRRLQKQLESRAEEASQLRRQLETRENTTTDVGALCARLRAAERDARVWRARAEAAERRVKVFEQFVARVRGLRDAAVQEGQQRREEASSASACSDRTETGEALRDRIRSGMRDAVTRGGGGGGGGGDGAGDDGEVFGGGGGGAAVSWDIVTAELWAAAEELLMFQDDMERCGRGSE